MRRRRTSFISLLVLIVIVACSNNGNVQPVPQPPQSSNNTSNQEAEGKEEEASSELDFDLDGRTLRIVSWYDMTIPEENPDDIQRKENLEALMKKHNFKVEYITIDWFEYTEKVSSSLLAGEPIGELIRYARPWGIPSLVKQNLFWEVDDFVTNWDVFNEKFSKVFAAYNGKSYGFETGTLGSNGIYYNRTLMNELGMKPLQEYVNEDNWNWDTFIKVAKEANRDTNNDGTVDTWGLAGGGLINQALASNETDLIVGNKQNLDDPKVVEAMEFINKLAVEKVIRPTEGGDWTEPGQFFRQGNTLMVFGADWEKPGYTNDMKEYDVGFVPFPQGPSAVEGYHGVDGAVNFMMIPKAIPNPEQLVYIWEKIHDIDSIYDYPHQALYESWFDNEDDINNARLAQAGMRTTDHNTYPSMDFYPFQGELLSGISVSTVVEKYKPQFQSAVDEVWNN